MKYFPPTYPSTVHHTAPGLQSSALTTIAVIKTKVTIFNPLKDLQNCFLVNFLHLVVVNVLLSGFFVVFLLRENKLLQAFKETKNIHSLNYIYYFIPIHLAFLFWSRPFY